MRRSVLLSVVVVALLATSLAMAQPPAGVPGPTGPGAGGPGGGPGMMGGGMMGGGMMGGGMMQMPVMTVTDKYVYVIFSGQLSMYNAETLELVKSVPLPMMRGGRDGRDGRRDGAQRGTAGNPPTATPAAPQ